MAQSDLINLEILKIARELVINDHTDRRANLHNRWLIESDKLWRTKRMKLAYPEIPPYPTEKEILDRARTLIDFLSNNEISEKKIKDHGKLFSLENKNKDIKENGSIGSDEN